MPSGIVWTLTSGAVFALYVAPAMPVMDEGLPSSDPLQDHFQVLPSPSTVPSVNFPCFSVSASMTKTSLFDGLPSAEVRLAEVEGQVLGVGLWVFAAKAKGVKADARTTGGCTAATHKGDGSEHEFS